MWCEIFKYVEQVYANIGALFHRHTSSIKYKGAIQVVEKVWYLCDRWEIALTKCQVTQYKHRFQGTTQKSCITNIFERLEWLCSCNGRRRFMCQPYAGHGNTRKTPIIISACSLINDKSIQVLWTLHHVPLRTRCTMRSKEQTPQKVSQRFCKARIIR